MGAVLISVLVAALFAVVASQEPCEIGTPNCDDTGLTVSRGITLYGDTDFELEWNVEKGVYAPLNLEVGQSLRLDYFSSHNVYLMSDGALGGGLICDFRGFRGPSIFLADGDPDGSGGTWGAEFTKPGKYCFSCGISFHCVTGQILSVLVGGATLEDECSIDESGFDFIPRPDEELEPCKKIKLRRQTKDTKCGGDLAFNRSETSQRKDRKCFKKCKKNKLCLGYQYEIATKQCIELAFIPDVIPVADDPDAEGFRCSALIIKPKDCDPTI